MPRDRPADDASTLRVAAELLLFSEAARALEAIEAVSPVLVIKGAALAELLWRPGERDMTDVDVVVPPDRFLAARHALAAAGWALLSTPARPLGNRWHRAFTARSRRGSLVDVHAAVAQRLRWPLPTRELFERATPFTLGGRRALRPALEDALVIAALNEAKDELAQRGASLEDMARLVSRGGLQWDVVVERARRWRAVVALWLALERVHARLGIAIPEEVRAALRPRRAPALERLFDLEAADALARLPPSRRLRQAVVGPLVTDSPLRFALSAAAWAAVRAADAVASTMGVGSTERAPSAGETQEPATPARRRR